MQNDLVARAAVDIDALADDIWFALTDPAAIARYMDGTRVHSDWRVGSPVRWSGEYDGRVFDDHGIVLEASPGKRLRYTHASSRPGEDGATTPVHVVTVALQGVDGLTRVTLEQQGAGDSEGCRQAQAHWQQMLDRLKRLVEQKPPSPL